MKKTLEDFIEKARKVHGDKFDYSKSVYKNCDEKLIIICPKHGEFLQTPAKHYTSKYCCPYCSPTGIKYSTEEFIKEAKKVHGDKFDYSLVVYKNNATRIKIICPKHGVFEQTPARHYVSKYCCPYCAPDGIKYSTEEFIEEAKKVHGDKYDYSLVDYIDAKTKIIIVCKKHGKFSVNPHNHISKKYDCPYCFHKSKGEEKIIDILKEHNIEFYREYKFDLCKNKLPLSFDFFIPPLNMIIEFQGEQHYKPIDFFGGETSFEKQKVNDEIKKEFCRKNSITLIEIRYDENIEEKLKKDVFNDR